MLFAETPRVLWVDLTSRCPLDCVFCSRRFCVFDRLADSPKGPDAFSRGNQFDNALTGRRLDHGAWPDSPIRGHGRALLLRRWCLNVPAPPVTFAACLRCLFPLLLGRRRVGLARPLSPLTSAPALGRLWNHAAPVPDEELLGRCPEW